jgi:hypothetical protein
MRKNYFKHEQLANLAASLGAQLAQKPIQESIGKETHPTTPTSKELGSPLLPSRKPNLNWTRPEPPPSRKKRQSLLSHL